MRIYSTPPITQSLFILRSELFLTPNVRAHATSIMYSLYFAYGSNLCPQQMGERCPGHVVIDTGVLLGWRWLINTRGVASVVLEADAAVTGVVYGITDAHIATLDHCEGVATGRYGKCHLDVKLSSGKEADSLIYIDPISEAGNPRPGYIEIVQRGAIHHGIQLDVGGDE
jgi:gamma-glutamylcyclotransferase (GGCT)/AIG2-like uncharacterized protein YtfP